MTRTAFFGGAFVKPNGVSCSDPLPLPLPLPLLVSSPLFGLRLCSCGQLGDLESVGEGSSSLWKAERKPQNRSWKPKDSSHFGREDCLQVNVGNLVIVLWFDVFPFPFFFHFPPSAIWMTPLWVAKSFVVALTWSCDLTVLPCKMPLLRY